MNEHTLRQLLNDVESGATSTDEAVQVLKKLPFVDMGFARIDHHRALRQALPEAIYGPGKTPEQCADIVGELLTNGTGPVILTRANESQIKSTLDVHPEGIRHEQTLVWRPAAERPGKITVITAGTIDIPVATECVATLTAYGFRPRLVVDCGVAGIHRLLATIEALDDLDALVVVAGMEGALASVVGGITGAPVVAVPTSFGYGASFQGMTALLAMLSSCAAGVSVVGIDNGFGAACAVARILFTSQKNLEST